MRIFRRKQVPHQRDTIFIISWMQRVKEKSDLMSKVLVSTHRLSLLHNHKSFKLIKM
nr:MAG TPA: hypothetical protein [Caudoviricetes sp.]DAI24775.1 MAG TPA: hypothetical protein [Caudoviricetes sp.]